MALITFGPIEAIVVVVVVLVVFGAGRLAGVGKALGTGLREFREEARSPEADSENGAADDPDAITVASTDASAAPSGDERKST